MGNNRNGNWMEDKRRQSNGHSFSGNAGGLSVLNGNRSKKMLETAAIKWIIADIIGGGFVLLGIASNFDNVRSLVLFFQGAIYFGVKIYYTIIKNDQARREKEMDLEDRAEARKRKSA
jgi:hypothetical protein